MAQIQKMVSSDLRGDDVSNLLTDEPFYTEADRGAVILSLSKSDM